MDHVSGVVAFFCSYKAEGDDDGSVNVLVYVVTILLLVAEVLFVVAGR